jgi:hypothetical protein
LGVPGLVAGAVLAHLSVIEIGRDVVVLRVPDDAGNWRSTRLWVVEHDGALWLHSAGPAWRDRFVDHPVVELDRHGQRSRYQAHPVPGAHPTIDRLLREKYGMADRWVRFIAPDDESVLVVRLDQIDAGSAPDAVD